MTDANTTAVLTRIAEALERLAPPPAPLPDLLAFDAFVWLGERKALQPVKKVSRVAINLLQGIDEAREVLLENTRQFIAGYPANNALLYGARGMGKSSLIKAIHAEVNAAHAHALGLVEIHREDLASLAPLLEILSASKRRWVVFCDDLSFENKDASYKALKNLLDGGLAGRPENVLIYATSNRKHLMPREMIENERSTAIMPSEATEEHVSLSDRFGISLGFYPCEQPTYLAIVERYAKHFKINLPKDELHAQALEWEMTRGGRSGRVAWQFVQYLAGKN